MICKLAYHYIREKKVTCAKFVSPKPQEKKSADLSLAFASLKRVAE